LYAQESSSEIIIIDNKSYEVTNIYTLDNQIQSTIARQKVIVADPAGVKASISAGTVISNPE
jgi:hypothetical protein